MISSALDTSALVSLQTAQARWIASKRRLDRVYSLNLFECFIFVGLQRNSVFTLQKAKLSRVDYVFQDNFLDKVLPVMHSKLNTALESDF